MGALTVVVLAFVVGVSLSEKTYVLPDYAENTFTLKNSEMIATAGDQEECWKIKYHIQPLRNSEYYMRNAPSPGMKNYVVRALDQDLFVMLSKKNDYRFEPLIPISDLGFKYIYVSCQLPGDGYLTELIIASHTETEVKVTFKVRGNATHEGNTYFEGDELNLTLRQLETLSLKSLSDLTGTVIYSTNSTVAVFMRIERYGTEMAFEQLIPVGHYGKEHVVAVDNVQYQLQVVGEYADTLIQFNNGSMAVLGPDLLYRQPLYPNASIYLNTSRPVMTSLCVLNSSKNGFVVVPPVSSYRRVAVISKNTTCKLFMDQSFSSLNVRQIGQAPISWTNISNSRFRVGSFRIQDVSLSLPHDFGVLCFVNTDIHNGGIGRINGEAKSRGAEYIIPTGLKWFIHSRSSTRGGSLEIQAFIPPMKYDVIEKYSGRDKCLSVTDITSSIYLRGTIDSSQFSPIPVSALGFKYIVSSCYFSRNETQVILITTHENTTDVDISFRLSESIFFKNIRYNNGDNITLSLAVCETVPLTFSGDASGSVIKSKDATIAVFSGVLQSGSMVAFEQLLPVDQHGTEHVVADGIPLMLLQVVSEHKDVNISFNNGTSELSKDGLYRGKTDPNEGLVMTSSKPVMATLCRERTFAVVPPKHTYFNQVTVYGGTTKTFTTTTVIKIILEGSDIEEVEVLPKILSPVIWTNISDTGYMVGTFYSLESVMQISSTLRFTILSSDFFNYMVNGGYNFSSGEEKIEGPPKEDDSWPTVFIIGAGTGLSFTTTTMVAAGILYRRRRRRDPVIANTEERRKLTERRVRPTHPGPGGAPPLIKP